MKLNWIDITEFLYSEVCLQNASHCWSATLHNDMVYNYNAGLLETLTVTVNTKVKYPDVLLWCNFILPTNIRTKRVGLKGNCGELWSELGQTKKYHFICSIFYWLDSQQAVWECKCCQFWTHLRRTHLILDTAAGSVSTRVLTFSLQGVDEMLLTCVLTITATVHLELTFSYSGNSKAFSSIVNLSGVSRMLCLQV